MPSAVVNRSGACPYCRSTNYDPSSTEARHPTQDKMRCLDCGFWSIRCKLRKFQFPVQVPSDKESSITCNTIY